MSLFFTISSVGPQGVPNSQPRASEAVTVAATASTATALIGEIWTVTAEADVYVAFGAAPDGSGSTRWRMKSGETRQFSASQNGEKIAFATS